MIDAIREKVNAKIALTSAEVSYLMAKNPVKQGEVIIGCLVPIGGVGEYCVQTVDGDFDFTGFTFEMKAE